MPATEAHRRLAEKFMFRKSYPQALVNDSLLSMLEHLYTEEEAEIVCALSFAPNTARRIAKKVHRPVSEVAPILDSMGERLLILSTKAAGSTLYSFVFLVPGVFEYQMIRSRNEGADTAYFKRFAELAEDFYDDFLNWVKPRAEGKDLRFMRVIPVEKSLDSVSGVLPHATDRYSEIVDRNNSFCLVNVCACRREQELLGRGCGRGMDVCSAMGYFADMAVEKGLARRVSREEFMEAKQRATELGLVHMVDNLMDPLQVCSCCTCCCGGLRMIKEYNVPTIIAGSHFEASVKEDLCIGCGKCVEICPMEAITLKGRGKKKKARVDYARCIGCGLCVPKCEKNRALELVDRPGHKLPSENLVHYFSERTRELAGREHSLLKGISYNVGSALYNISPVKIAGPRYKPKR